MVSSFLYRSSSTPELLDGRFQSGQQVPAAVKSTPCDEHEAMR
jgi:hypothetical protein